MTTATYDAQDRMTAYGDTTYTYSPAGRLTSATTGGQTTSYTYDPAGNLTAVTLPDATTVSYKVDPDGRRIARSVNGAMTEGLIYAGGLAPIAATDAAGAIASTFTYGSRGNVPDAMVKSGVTYRIVSDHLGSVRLVVNAATGAVAQRMDYDTFGNVVTDTNPGFTPFGFAGGLYDSATKLTRFGARDYDAHTGRWTTKDPIGFAGGDANLYAYVANDPVNNIDPKGLGWWEDRQDDIYGVGEQVARGARNQWDEQWERSKNLGGDLYDSWNDGVLCEYRQKAQEALRFLADFADIYAKIAWCVAGEFLGPQGSSPGGELVKAGRDMILIGLIIWFTPAGEALLLAGGATVGAGLALIAAECEKT